MAISKIRRTWTAMPATIKRIANSGMNSLAKYFQPPLIEQLYECML